MSSSGISGVKRGYLNEDFMLFHLKDQKNSEFEFHYHEFNKIIVFISGRVTYLIEGKAYKLQPWDILLVSSKEVHKPIIDPGETYERIVIWVYPEFLEKHNSNDCNLLTCFELSSSEKYNVMRLKSEAVRNIKYILSQLEEAGKAQDFGSRILKNALFVQLIVHINRKYLGLEKDKELKDVVYDEQIGAVLKFINENLGGDLSIDSLSYRFYMSKYYLMHKFKTQTGYSIHSYILQKRLILANSLIKKGLPVTEVSVECGFGDYANFIKAFKKMFGESPRKYYKNLLEASSSGNSHFD